VPIIFPDDVKLVNVPTLVIFGCALDVTVPADPAELEYALLPNPVSWLPLPKK
jgi:hypothetical protein